VILIGRFLLIEFQDKETHIFNEVVDFLKKYYNLEKLCTEKTDILSLLGLEIHLQSRKIFCDRQEIHLTTKEYDLLSLLVANKGRVLTYAYYVILTGHTMSKK